MTSALLDYFDSKPENISKEISTPILPLRSNIIPESCEFNPVLEHTYPYSSSKVVKNSAWDTTPKISGAECERQTITTLKKSGAIIVNKVLNCWHENIFKDPFISYYRPNELKKYKNKNGN